jgi:hypothetical protein
MDAVDERVSAKFHCSIEGHVDVLGLPDIRIKLDSEALGF